MTPTSTTSPPAQPGGEGRELLITHTYTEGTVLTGTHRNDDLYRLLRSHGWLYRRSMSDYRLQASQDRPAKTGPIEYTAAALRQRGFTVTVDLDTTPRRGVSPEHIAECALTPQRWARLDEQQTHLTEQLTHWSAVRQAQIRDGLTPNYTRADLAPGDLICYRGQWLPVVRCNPKSVSVPSIVGGTWTDTVRYDRIRDRARPGELRWPQLAIAALAHAHHWSQGLTLHPAWQQLTGP